MSSVRSIILLLLGLVCSMLLVAACETAPPVQEMSDARQAIAVAREAGAEDYATDELMAAEQHLSDAEKRLSAEEYGAARRAAVQAKSRALTAARLSEINRPNDQR